MARSLAVVKSLRLCAQGLAKPFSSDRRRGMTLMEIIIVIAILGTMMTLLITNLSSKADKAKEDQTKIAMGNIRMNLDVYRVHNNRYPSSLQALLENPGDAKNWRGPYAEPKQLKDAWDSEYGYESDGRNFKIISGGMDGTLGTDDDITYPEAVK